LTYLTIYAKPSLDRIRQGEVLSKVPNILADRATGEPQLVPHEYAKVVTPDCDIERHWEDVKAGRPRPEAKLHFVIGWPASDRTIFPAAVWGKIKKSDQISSQALESCPSDCDLEGSGLPALIFDFRTMFSMPADLIYSHINQQKIQRRTQLQSPYRDHFIQRFSSYFGRVALEKNHEFPGL